MNSDKVEPSLLDIQRLYSAEQIVVPPALPSILKNWVKEVIRNNPSDIEEFSKNYFTELSKQPQSDANFEPEFEPGFQPPASNSIPETKE